MHDGATRQRTAGSADGDAVDDILRQWATQWPDLDVSALAVFGRLHRSYALYHASLNEVFHRHGINMASFDVLAALRRSGPPYQMSLGQLAESSLVTTGGITQRVDRLEKSGLVQRERDPDDRRVVYARLTTAGLDKVHEVSRDHFANEKRMLAGLSDAECGELAGLLSRLEASVVAAEDEMSA